MILYTANEYQQFIRQQLESLSPIMVTEIQTIISKYSDKQACILNVEIYSDNLNGCLPIKATLFDNKTEIETWKLVNSIHNVLPPEQMEVLQQFDHAGVEITEVTYQTLIEWFADCWQQMDGSNSKIHAQISILDDIEAFDLNRRKWIQKEAVAEIIDPS